MFIFDDPYLSEVAKDYLVRSQSPVLENCFSQEQLPQSCRLVAPSDAIRSLEEEDFRWIYTNSENALTWLIDTLDPSHRLLRNITIFKNKRLFRKETHHLFPEIEFKEIHADEVESFAFDQIGKPFIIKPTVGFLSAGVYRINNEQEWLEVRERILEETKQASKAFPDEVLNHQAFLIESIIEGEEFAIDAYIDENNDPVVLNILHHRFRDQQDMSDRLYVTSAQMIRTHLTQVEAFLSSLVGIGDFRGMPLHIEVRINDQGRMLPIEVNPLRFAGWCSTDIAYYAFGLNVYEYFDQRKRPDWDRLLAGKENHCYALAVIEKQTSPTETQYFDYEHLRRQFPSMVELRQMDYRKFPLFAFAFLDVDIASGPTDELDRLLEMRSDLFLTSK